MPNSLRSSPRCASRISQVENTGTRVLESRYDAIIANADRQRQRHEELPADADHEERRHEDGEDAEHREQARHGGAAARFHHRLRARDAGQHLGMNVLDLDRRLVHQHADRERQAAERHDVDGLARQPRAGPPRPSSANGMFSTTISALRQSRRKSRTIRPVSTAPSRPSMTSPRMALVT